MDASAMWAANIETGGRVHIAWSQFNREALSAADRRAIERGEDDDDREAYAFLKRSQRQVIYDEPTMFGVAGPEELPASRPREMARALGLTHRMACALNHSGPWLDCLLLQSGEVYRPVSRQKDDKSDLLIPILSQSLALERTFSTLRARFGGALAHLGELGIGVFLVNRQGVIMERNAEADRILEQ
ncbi:hypothetical protein [Tranquillimonas rosea]|uniref:hypothetical protein n=1 Tax=Tranquillimonas rosea TaxID=641238 RepID=UPI003BABC999